MSAEKDRIINSQQNTMRKQQKEISNIRDILLNAHRLLRESRPRSKDLKGVIDTLERDMARLGLIKESK